MESLKIVFESWYKRYFGNVEAIILFLILTSLIIIFEYFGDVLKPLFASALIAYLLSGVVISLESLNIPHPLAAIFVYLLFIGSIIFAVLGIFPPLWGQAIHFFNEVPNMLARLHDLLSVLPEKYPEHFSAQQIQSFTMEFKSVAGTLGSQVLSFSLSTLSSLVSIVLYCVIVPLLVYFFLMDRTQILRWCGRFLPRERETLRVIWHDIDEQIAKYIRGRILEILIVSVISYIAFGILGLDYAMLLAVITGISVIIPYIGAILVVIPVLLVAFLQWSWSAHFAYVAVAYSTITILSGYVLEPILFSEALNLHPAAIIISILIFGGIWGFWGVFFAIPLAAIIRAIVNAWPREQN